MVCKPILVISFCPPAKALDFALVELNNNEINVRPSVNYASSGDRS